LAARLYHDDQYDFSRPVASYWEAASGERLSFGALTGDLTSDVAIIGGGYTGLSSAYHLGKDFGISAVVLEAGPIGWGASGRNGGFSCFGAASLSPDAMIKRYGQEETRRFYAAQRDGIDLVKSIAETEGFDIAPQGDGILVIAHKPSRFAELQGLETHLKTFVGVPVRLMEKDKFASEMFQSAEQFGGLWVGAGYGINPLKYVRGLAQAAARKGAKIFEDSEVVQWTKAGAEHVLETREGRVRARTVIVACNGWMPEALDGRLSGRVLPVMSNIIVTRPLTDTELKAQNWKTDCPVSNTRELLFYFRLLPDKRMLFGGRGDTIGSAEAAAPLRAYLEGGFRRLFPNWKHVEVSHFWRGFIAMTSRATPALGRLEEDCSVLIGYGCHGNGVAWSTWAGQWLAAEVAGTAEALPVPVLGQPRRFPLPQWRITYLRAALTALRVVDRWF
jgi:glycine/D-amino acid oxidase-like deaminating enzyme